MPIKFTKEANAISAEAPIWREEISALLAPTADCNGIEVVRTPGARRERSRPPRKSDAAGRGEAAARAALMQSVPGIVEAFSIGASEIGVEEAHLTETDEAPMQNRIGQAVFGHDVADLHGTDLEDVVHTHSRNARDVFITTDERILAAASKTDALGFASSVLLMDWR